MAVDVETETGEEGQQQEEDAGVSCSLDMFREYQEVCQMVESIEQQVETEVTAEKAFEDLKKILDYYQEQPHLLDPHLEELLTRLVEIVRSHPPSSPTTLQAFKYLWLITKVRGYKLIFKKLSHEVKDLLPVLQMLETPEGSSDFYASYILLLWLSIIVYMPFNMMGFDATVAGKEPQSGATVVQRVLEVIKTHLKSAQKSREMAAYLASRFVTRPDLRDEFLPQFIDYCFEVLEKESQDTVYKVFNKLGVLRALGLIFKHGKREEMLELSHKVFPRLVACGVTKSSDTTNQKACHEGHPAHWIMSWRYQRGSRSLAINVHGDRTEHLQGNVGDKNTEEEEEEDEEVGEDMEEVIDYLLQGLKDQDTVVRWSAAKGVGRVTGRLPREFGDEVVGAIMELFSSRESDKAWHGGCLALAELARRGLLLPERLPVVTPILTKALVYDELKGKCFMGANIRDAACYLCWAFARAYHPDQMAPYVNQLATGLLIVALFDREIPCRRAGSAAFQEHVGRQGAFPHGIEILTTVDYFAVGNRSNAFLNLSVQVAKFPEYTQALIDHLVQLKVIHWDSAIRELTAKALHNLTPFDPDYMAKTVLPKLLELTTSLKLAARHGSILAVAHITHALALETAKQGTALMSIIGQDVLDGIVEIVPTLETRKLLRGLDGEYMKQASAVLIEKCSLAALPLHDHDILEVWHKLLEGLVVAAEENIRLASLQALAPLWAAYFQPNSEAGLTWRDDLVERYTKALKTEKEIQSQGFSAALGYLTQPLVHGKFDVVLQALIKTTEITPETSCWAQARQQAITSIIKLVDTVGIKKDGKESEQVCEDNLELIYKALLRSLDDYTMDRRGDIGAWVREAAIITLKTLTNMILAEDPSLLSEEIVGEMMARVSQQAAERIDRTRKVAGSAFAALLHSSPRLPHIPNLEEVDSIFPKKLCDDMNWASEKSTFTLFMQLVDFPAYRPRMLLGITYAAGGISANLSRYTSEAMHGYLNARAEKVEVLAAFLETLLQQFATHQKVDRITLPLLRTMGDILSSSAVLDSVLEQDDTYISQLLTLMKKECLRCSDYHKLAAVIAVLCELLRLSSPTTKTTLTQLSLFLGYQYPKVRAVTATSLLTALQDYCDQDIVPPEHLEEVTNILEDTEWMNNLEDARKQRNRICELAGISSPQPKKK
ncbi:Tubulin-specific chaperone D [Chionoecetes opilio]|uniref:Tubulin-specific chaperone D n=1 Tax=Chionoecetes opilio TaxID=41210 RepID=A0A8J4Y1F3_CHIOP|nr:Tubulin-specific chaperone D [Chionoecetes opilio]